jgi:septation ring formation regulator EzrA
VPGGPPPGGPGGFGGPPPGGPGGGGFGQIAQAQADLQAALNDAKTSPQEIKEKVAALRKAREKARADLEAAQKDLVELLTDFQEAVLMGLGYLD